MKKNNKLRNAVKRFRQGRITLEKLNLIKLNCDLDDAKKVAEIQEQEPQEDLQE